MKEKKLEEIKETIETAIEETKEKKVILLKQVLLILMIFQHIKKIKK